MRAVVISPSRIISAETGLAHELGEELKGGQDHEVIVLPGYSRLYERKVGLDTAILMHLPPAFRKWGVDVYLIFLQDGLLEIIEPLARLIPGEKVWWGVHRKSVDNILPRIANAGHKDPHLVECSEPIEEGKEIGFIVATLILSGQPPLERGRRSERTDRNHMITA